MLCTILLAKASLLRAFTPDIDETYIDERSKRKALEERSTVSQRCLCARHVTVAGGSILGYVMNHVLTWAWSSQIPSLVCSFFWGICDVYRVIQKEVYPVSEAIISAYIRTRSVIFSWVDCVDSSAQFKKRMIKIGRVFQKLRYFWVGMQFFLLSTEHKW